MDELLSTGPLLIFTHCFARNWFRLPYPLYQNYITVTPI